MNFKGFVAALVAGLAITTAAEAGVTVHKSDFLGATGHFNGFEGISAPIYSNSRGYTEGGIKVQYVGRDLTTLTTLNPQGKRSWTPLIGGFGYTRISLADGAAFEAIEFLAGSSSAAWFTPQNLQYQLFLDGTMVFDGFLNGLSSVYGSLKTFGFSGTDGQLFDEIRLQNVSGKKFERHGFDQLILDSITISPASISSAVPEPATWAMMIIGFGTVGSLMRQSRRRAALAFA
jgi:hypothetical protein